MEPGKILAPRSLIRAHNTVSRELVVQFSCKATSYVSKVKGHHHICGLVVYLPDVFPRPLQNHFLLVLQ